MAKRNKREVVLTQDELKQMLIQNNIKVQPAYKHKEYMYTSFTMPYPVKAKLERLQKKYKLSRSAVVRMLIESVEE